MLDLVAYAKKKKEINQSLPDAWVMHLLDGLFYAGWQMQQGEGTSAEEAAKLAYRSFCRGVTS
jgi:hypothetical protein